MTLWVERNRKRGFEEVCGGYGWIRTTDPIIMSDVL
jgi:hypothetical protein